MAVLVTGIGYIGSALTRRLLARGEEIIGLDNLFSTDRHAVDRLAGNRAFRFVEGSVADPEAVERAFSLGGRIGTVFHLAAQASAHPDAAPPGYTEETNLTGPRLILDAMLRHGIETLVFGSSFRVYGPSPAGPVDETTPYGAFGDLSHLSKCYVEKLMEMYSLRHGMRCIPVRVGVVYGVAPVMKRDYRFMTAPNKFCLQALRGEEIAVTAAGAAPAGFIHVDDAVEAILLAGDKLAGYAPANAVTESHSVSWVAEVVREEASRRGISVDVRCDTPSEFAGDLHPVSVLSDYGFRARRDIRTAVPEMLDYFSLPAAEQQ